MPKYNYSTRKWEKTKEEEEEEYRKAYEEQTKQSQTQQVKKKNGLLDNWFKTPEAFKDGYDFGDVTKTLIGTGIKGANEFTKGILNIGEGVGDTITYGEYHLLKKTGWFKNYIDPEDLKKEAQKDIFNNLFKESDKVFGKNSITDSKTDSIINSVGYMYGLQATAGLGKTAGAQTMISTATTFGSAYGHAMTEAYNGGATDKEARQYALIAATAESASELMFGGIGKGTNAVGLSRSAIPIDDMVAQGVSKRFKSKVMQNLTQWAIKSGGEGVEELVSGFFSAVGKKMTYMKDEDFNKILEDEHLLDQFVSGMVSAGISSSPSAVRATKNGQSYVTGRTDSEQQIYDRMIENKSNEKLSEKNNLIKNKAINEALDKRIAELKEKNPNAKINEKRLRDEIAKKIDVDTSNTKLTKRELSQINEEVDSQFEKGKLNINDIYEIYTPEETNKINRLESKLNEDLSEDTKNAYAKELEDTIKQRNEKIAKAAETNQSLGHTLYNEELKKTNFELTKEEKKLAKSDEKIKNLYDDAVKYGNNTEDAHKFVNSLGNMSKQTEHSYRLTDTKELADMGYNVYSKYEVRKNDTLNSIAKKYNLSKSEIMKANNMTNDNITAGQELNIPNIIINGTHDHDNKTIYINMDSKNALNVIVGHETGHIFENTSEYTELQNMLVELAKADGTYYARKAELENLYKDVKNSNIDVELTNDLLGEKLFTDEKFIERLAKKPNLFTKIKDKIDDLVIQFKGTEEEKELRKIQNKFLEVYRKNNLQEYVADADAKAKSKTKKSTDKNVDFMLSKNALNDVNEIVKMTQKDAQKSNIQFVKLKDNTIKKLVDYGVPDLPMLERVSHVRENILSKDELKKLGFSINEKKHYHELGVDKYLEIIDSMDNADNVYQYTNEPNVFIIETPVEINGIKSIVPVTIKRSGRYNNVNIEFNKIKTAFTPDYKNYIQNMLNKGTIKEIVTGDNPQQVSLRENNIPQSEQKSKSTKADYSLSKKSDIQGLEHYSKNEIKNLTKDYIVQTLQENGIDADIVDLEIHGSRNRGDAKNNSDLDVVVQYKGDIREDDLFNTLNNNGDENLYIDGIKVDINPIQEELSEYMKRSDEYDKNIKNGDNKKYSLSVKEANTGKDNDGNKLSKGQKEKFADSKATDENGNLIKVYHTTTDKIVQFNEFNPVGTPYYRFGDQVVNFFTDSQDMSGSYADQDYEIADTKMIQTDKEVNKIIENNNSNDSNTEVSLKKNDDGSYTLYNKKVNDIAKIADDLRNKYSENVLDEVSEWLNKQETTLDEYIQQQPYPLPNDIVNGMKAVAEELKLEELPNKEDWYSDENTEVIKLRNGLRDNLSETKYTEDTYKKLNRGIFKEYKSKEELYKNIKQDLNTLNGVEKNYQYQGYLNITNPYIVDAEERNWNQVISQSNEFIDELESRVPDDVKNNLTRLYNESANKSSELREKYIENQVLIQNIDTNLKYTKDTKAMNELCKRIGIEKMESLSNNPATTAFDVNDWYALADILKQYNVAGDSISNYIIDEFRVPESLREWIDRELYGEIDIKDNKNLIELHENYQKSYEDFDKYRMPYDYFIEQIKADGNDYLGNELEDILETRAETYGADVVAEEIADAAKVGFSKPELIRLWGTSKTTNDIVNDVLVSNKDGLTNYDGVIIKNVYDYGGKSNEGEKSSHNIYITFNSNQFKSADNTSPTDDADIRYSISKKTGKLEDSNGNEVKLETSDTGNTGTLMAIHNLNSDKLNGILDLGGFPSASIAVTNNYMSNANFGNISVLFDKSTIDPELNSANKVYSRDAYTTRVPKIANEINEAGLNEVSKNIGIETWDLKSRYNEKSIEEVVDEIRTTDEMLDKYLETKDIKVPPVYRDFKGLLSLNQKYYEDFINKHPELMNMDYTDRMSYSTYEKYYPDVHNLFVNEAVEKGNGKITKQQAESLYKDYPHYNHWDYFLRDLNKVQELNGNQEFDEYATNEAKKMLVDLNSKEYLDFVKETISPMFGDKFVRNNKDFYTKSGNPRSFRQRYEPYTLENIVRIMNENAGTGQEGSFFTGIGELAGDASKRFTSIDDIKANEKLLQTQDREEYQNILSKYSDEMRDITYDILDQYGSMDTESYIWRDKAVAESMKAIARKIADGKNITTKGIIQQFKRNYIDITDNQAKRVNSLIKNLSDIPTDYFEAKPQRAIRLNEIQAVVLPNTTDNELKNRLKELGINYVEYDPSIDGDRNRVINQFDDLKFSLSRKGDIAPIKGTYQVYSKDIRNKINENNLAPIREDITPTTYDDVEAINRQYSEQPIPEDTMTSEKVNPMEDRNIEEVGNKSIKAYQYENPEVKPYYQEMARYMLTDLDNSVKGERYATDSLEFDGVSRQVTDDIAYLLDEYNYSYDDIRKGLKAIIEDNGAENIAVAKRLEVLINDRLLNGYVDSFGYDIPANEDYINLAKELTQNDQLAPVREDIDYSAFDDIAPIKNELERLSKKDAEKYRKMREKYQEQIDNAKKVRKDKKSALRKFNDNFKSLFVNENQELDNLAKESKNPTIKHKADMLNNYVVEAKNDIDNYQTDYNGKEIGKSVKQLFQEAKKQGLYESFNDYLINWSNIDRHKQGKGSLRTADTSSRLNSIYEMKYPQFKEWGKDVWKYGKNALNSMEQAGLIDEKLKTKLEDMYPHYVPFMDNADLNKFIGSNDEIVPKKTIKSAYGGMSTTQILPMEDALTRYAYSYRKAMRQNDLYSEIVKTLRANEISDVGAGDTRTEVTNLKESLYRDENGNYLKAYIDGDTKVVSITDDLYKSLSNDLKYQIKDLEERLSLITKPVQAATKLKGKLATSWSPTFIVKNFIKDYQDALINSTDTAKFMKYYPSSIKELIKNDTEQVRQFRALYGSAMGQYSNGDISAAERVGKTKNIIKKIANANEIIELAPRYAEFKASLANGASIQEAMYNAREVTTNFSRGGTITKALNRNGFNFLNASVQGFDKFVRNFSGQNGAKAFTGTLIKAIALGVAPAAFNELVFGSGDDKDEEYEALPDYIKDNYYLFKTDDGTFIRIPKGRALSVFGSAARRAIEYYNGEEDAWNGYLTNTWNQIGFNNPDENFLLTPIIQAKNNKTWYGGDIVPTRLQDKPAGEQSDEKTDLLSKWLGEKINISPKKINYVIDQYSAGVGDIILPTITPEATSDAETPVGKMLAPIKDQFVVNSIDDNKYVSDFYTNNDKLKVQANSEYATDDDVLKYKYSSSVSSELSQLYKEKRLIQNDSSLSNSEKFRKSQAIKKQINEIAKEGLNTYKDVDVVGNYGEVNGVDYYKNNKNEWTKVKEEDADDIKKFGLTAQEKNNYFNAKNDISTITTKYKELSKTSTDKEKTALTAAKKEEIITRIMNTKMSDDAKAYLYSKYYDSEEKMNVISSLGIDIDKYLDFELQNFQADKDAKGNTIKNSKKTKMINYLNQMQGTYGEKLIIYKLNNLTDTTYNQEIVNYVNSANIPLSEKREILKVLKMEVDSNGNVRW